MQRNDAASEKAGSVEKKTVKRKPELPPTPIIEEKRRATVDAIRAKKPPEVDYNQLPPRYHGKMSRQLAYCQKILRELQTSKNYSGFTWPFLEPVDVEAFGLYDYYDIIKEPMDFSTMQKKMTAKQYANPDEFYADMQLIWENCFRYNPEGQPVNKCGKDLKVELPYYSNSPLFRSTS
jgi:bromodomain-containing factor 1